MILIVADAGPANYLIQTGHVAVLPALADRIVLPISVRAELLHGAAPDAVRGWAAALPDWVEVLAAKESIVAPDISEADREATALARELSATLLLMDNRQARRCAAALGTVGILEVAAARGVVALPEALERLRATSCFLSDEILDSALKRDAERCATGG